MGKVKIKYTYKKYKNYLGEIRDFFESLDMSNLNETDLRKIDLLKDVWTEYLFECVCDVPCHLGDERVGMTIRIFKISNSVEDKNIHDSLMNFAYLYMLGMKEDVFWPFEEEKLNKSLKDIELISIDEFIELYKSTGKINYFIYKRMIMY